MEALVDDRLIEMPPEVLAERERLGLDGRDEVWNGILHMNPPPSNEHSRVQHELFLCLHPLVRQAGLEVRMELGLFNPAYPTPFDFRVPDLTVFRPEISTRRGADGAAEMAIEVRSPGDDSFKKLPHYDAMGIGEVVIAHRDSTWVRHWTRVDGRLVESEPADGRHRLQCVPVVIWSDGARLFTEVAGETRPL